MSLIERFPRCFCRIPNRTSVQYERKESNPRSDKGFSGVPALPSRFESSYAKDVRKDSSDERIETYKMQ